MQKKRILMIAAAIFAFAVALFTTMFLTILQPTMEAGKELTVKTALPPSSYATLPYGDLSSLLLIIAMFAALIYIILKS